jgi:hypothetical protein
MGMENMSREEAREAIREILDKWNTVKGYVKEAFPDTPEYRIDEITYEILDDERN